MSTERSSLYLGQICEQMEDLPRAIMHYQESLTIFISLELRRIEYFGHRDSNLLEICGSIYNNLGRANLLLYKYNEALKFYQQSLQIFRDMKDQENEAISLNGVGRAYFSLGEYKQAIKCYEQSLELAQAIEDQKGKLVAYGNLGNVYNARDNTLKRLSIIKKV